MGTRLYSEGHHIMIHSIMYPASIGDQTADITRVSADEEDLTREDITEHGIKRDLS